MRCTRPLILAACAALALAGCARGDLSLTEKDRADRARGTVLTQTFQKKVPYHGSADYALGCLSGTALASGSARIANVAGSWNTAADYRIVTRLDHSAGRVVASVTHIGTHVQKTHQADAPYVVVELTASCQTPAAKG